MTKQIVLQAVAALFVLAGCTAQATDTNEATKASSAVSTKATPSGLYKVVGGDVYAWASMNNGVYRLWKAGDECNKDISKAPASCLETGKYSFNNDNSIITFVDDATGDKTSEPYEVKTVGTAKLVKSTATVQTTGAQKSTDSQNGDQTDQNNQNDENKPVATALNLRQCMHALYVACSLMGATPDDMPDPIPELEPGIEQVEKKKVQQG